MNANLLTTLKKEELFKKCEELCIKVYKSKTKKQLVDMIVSTSRAYIYINRGTGAGGKNTNLFGKKFEQDTDNESRLLEMGYTKRYFHSDSSKSNYYLEKEGTCFTKQGAFKKYVKQKYNLVVPIIPDEAYIINVSGEKTKIKILEKKEQRCEGSVEQKLEIGQHRKEKYQMMFGTDFVVDYGFCVNKFLQDKILSDKYTIDREIWKRHKIIFLFGEEDNYYDTLDRWLKN